MDRAAVAVALACLLGGSVVRAGILADQASSAQQQRVAFVEGADGWRFLPAELRFADKLASPEISSMAEPAVAAIADFAAQLQSAGIGLAVVPVPPKVLVQPAVMRLDAAETEKMRAGWKKIIDELAARGVPVIDLLTDYTGAPEAVFCRRDTHWSGPGIEAAVTRLVPALEAAGLTPRGQTGAPGPWKEISINGDLGGEPEKVPLRFSAESAEAAPNAPLLLFGDSHVLVFHQGGDLHTTGAGLPERLAAVFGPMPDVLGVRGSGATSARLQLARRLRTEPDYLREKKMIVWVFAGREFTEADMWKKIPVFPRRPGA